MAILLRQLGVQVCTALLFGLSAAYSAESPAQTLEYKVKAAFLLNFSKFIDWPEPEAGKESPIAICIVGEDPFGSTLDQIVEGEVVGGRKIVVQRVAKATQAGC